MVEHVEDVRTLTFVDVCDAVVTTPSNEPPVAHECDLQWKPAVDFARSESKTLDQISILEAA